MRLFVGIPLPEAVKQTISQLPDSTLPVRWTRPDAYHLTLIFIGEVQEPQANEIRNALYEITPMRGFDVEVASVGCFPDRKKPKVLWTGVQPHEPVAELHRQINRMLCTIKAPKDEKKFHPHITFGRVKKPNRSITSYIESHSDKHFGHFTVSGFNLYSSTLQPAGAVHTIIEHYPLEGNNELNK